MAHDLIFGRTLRDWSVGGAAPTPTTEVPRDRLPPAPALAESVRAELARTSSLIIRLRHRGKIPEAEWQGYRQLHRRWVTLSDARRGRWRESDTLALWNLREAGRDYARKLAALEKLGSPPTPPPETSRALVPPPGPTLSAPWYVAAGAALALAWTGFFAALRERSSKT